MNTKNDLPDLLNPISAVLLAILAGSSLLAIWIFNFAYFPSNLWGFVFGGIAAYLCTQFTYPEPSPKRVRILTLFGQKTKVKTYGLVLICKPLVSYVEISLKQEDVDITIDPPLLCTAESSKSSDLKPIIQGYLSGNAQIQAVADDRSAESLNKFDDIGRIEGFKALVDDQIPQILQRIADDPGMNMLWMEINGKILGIFLQSCLSGIPLDPNIRQRYPAIPALFDLSLINLMRLNNVTDFGVKIVNVAINLKPQDPDTTKARNGFNIEVAERLSDEMNEETIQRLTEKVLILSHYGMNEDGVVVCKPDPDDKRLTVDQAREKVLRGMALKADKLTIIDNNGLNVANVRK